MWKVAGVLEDTSSLVNFAHVKGHPSCGYGGPPQSRPWVVWSAKRVGPCMTPIITNNTGFKKLPGRRHAPRIITSCPFGALVEDKEHPGEIHLHYEQCNNCMHCLKVALSRQPVHP